MGGRLSSIIESLLVENMRVQKNEKIKRIEWDYLFGTSGIQIVGLRGANNINIKSIKRGSSYRENISTTYCGYEKN